MRPHVLLPLMLACLLVGGCAPALRIEPAGAAGQGSGGSRARMPGSFARLVDDIPRAIERCHWGKIEVYVDTNGGNHSITASALLPNDKEAKVSAWSIDAQTVEVVVRVGLFGDAPAEREYLETLVRTLAGPPKPKRDSKFTLPDDF